MELRHLKYFVAVAESLNLSKASTIVNITQPALSRQIRDLEEEVGVALFRRLSSGVALTEQGQVFLVAVRKILLAADDAVRAATNVGVHKPQRLRIGVEPDIASPRFFKILSEYGESDANTEIEIVEAPQRTLVEQIRSESLECALLSSRRIDLTEEYEVLQLERNKVSVMLSAHHRYSSSLQIDLASLEGENLVMFTDRYTRNNRVLGVNLCRRVGFDPPRIIEVSSYCALVGLVSAGRGFSLIPADTALGVFSGIVKIIPTIQNWDSPGGSFVWLRGSESLQREAFVSRFTKTRGGQLMAIA